MCRQRGGGETETAIHFMLNRYGNDEKLVSSRSSRRAVSSGGGEQCHALAGKYSVLGHSSACRVVPHKEKWLGLQKAPPSPLISSEQRESSLFYCTPFRTEKTVVNWFQLVIRCTSRDIWAIYGYCTLSCVADFCKKTQLRHICRRLKLVVSAVVVVAAADKRKNGTI